MDQDKEFLSTQVSTNNEVEKEDKLLFLLLQFRLFWASWGSFIFLPVVLINVREDCMVYISVVLLWREGSRCIAYAQSLTAGSFGRFCYLKNEYLNFWVCFVAAFEAFFCINMHCKGIFYLMESKSLEIWSYLLGFTEADSKNF